MQPEKKQFLSSLVFPSSFLVLLWLIKIAENYYNLNLYSLGIYPLKLKGLLGIITSPLIHSGFSHLIANSSSLFFLSLALFYFYKEIAYKIFFLVYFLTGLWVWFFARESYHIGASGVIYGLASFLFASGIIRKNMQSMAISMLVIFLYGGMVWGIFPDFFPKENISWESHFMGLLAGIVLAIYYKKQGPQRKKYEWEEEQDEENDDVIIDNDPVD